MLSGEGNENGEKTTIGLISKKQLCTCSTLFCTFLCRCFARLQRETSRNFLVTRFVEEISYLFLFTLFFSLPLIFTSVAATVSLFFTTTTKFSRSFSNKNCLLCFLSLAVALCRSFFLFELCWPLASFIFFSIFLFLYIPNFWT